MNPSSVFVPPLVKSLSTSSLSNTELHTLSVKTLCLQSLFKTKYIAPGIPLGYYNLLTFLIIFLNCIETSQIVNLSIFMLDWIKISRLTIAAWRGYLVTKWLECLFLWAGHESDFQCGCIFFQGWHWVFSANYYNTAQ